jgi:hypothetical protein
MLWFDFIRANQWAGEPDWSPVLSLFNFTARELSGSNDNNSPDGATRNHDADALA